DDKYLHEIQYLTLRTALLQTENLLPKAKRNYMMFLGVQHIQVSHSESQRVTYAKLSQSAAECFNILVDLYETINRRKIKKIPINQFIVLVTSLDVQINIFHKMLINGTQKNIDNDDFIDQK